MAQVMPSRTFFSLPLKIRLRIYRYAFASVSLEPYGPRYGKPTSAISFSRIWSLPATPGLLCVSHRIYKEAVEVLYGSNIFHFANPNYPLNWLKTIGPINIGRLRQLSIFVDADARENTKKKWLLIFQKLYEELSSLEILRVFFDAYNRTSTGLGKDPDIHVAIGRLRSLESIQLNGDYSSHLPELLRRETGADVLDCGWK